MEAVDLLRELESLSEALGIEVRYEPLEGSGGLCRYGGNTYVIIPNDLSLSQRVDALVDVLARQPYDTVFVRPHLRDLLNGRMDA